MNSRTLSTAAEQPMIRFVAVMLRNRFRFSLRSSSSTLNRSRSALTEGAASTSSSRSISVKAGEEPGRSA